jgi:hypothetical protein
MKIIKANGILIMGFMRKLKDESQKNRHPLHDKVEWIRKNLPFVTVHNNARDGYLVITISKWETGGQGRTFLQSEMDACMEYVKKLKS